MRRSRHHLHFDAALLRPDQPLDDHRVLIALVLHKQSMFRRIDEFTDPIASVARAPHQLTVIVRLEELPMPIGVEATEENTAWTFSYRNQKVLVYAFAPQKFKPYVKELYTLQGENILRDSPHYRPSSLRD